jgi:hypothetical protein
MRPKLVLALATLALALFAGIGSAASASGPRDQIKAGVGGPAAKLGDHKLGKAVKSFMGRKLGRSHSDFSDPACPLWSVRKPWSGYGTIGTEASAICVEEVRGHDIDGNYFHVSQAPELGILALWQKSGSHKRHWSTSGTFGHCFGRPVNMQVYLWHIEAAVLCSTHMFVHASKFPPTGVYHGYLGVVTYNPRWTDGVMLSVDSENFCWFC